MNVFQFNCSYSILVLNSFHCPFAIESFYKSINVPKGVDISEAMQHMEHLGVLPLPMPKDETYKQQTIEYTILDDTRTQMRLTTHQENVKNAFLLIFKQCLDHLKTKQKRSKDDNNAREKHDFIEVLIIIKGHCCPL